MQKILLIEDDPAIAKGIQAGLGAEGFIVSVEANGTRGFEAARHDFIDLILLDIILPGKNGMEICRDLRREGIITPIIMLTSKKDEADKVNGLDLGADDYVTKPFSLTELAARVRALLRRSVEHFPGAESFSFGTVTVNFKNKTVTSGGAVVKCSGTEFALLSYFIAHEGEVISREKLLDDVWGYDAFPTTRTVDNFVLSLRKKLELNPASPVHLVTVPKQGYRFVK